MIKIHKKNQKAFTLIELLVVISIIGLLSSVVMASVNGARAKGSIAAGQKFESHTNSAFFDDLVLSWDFDSSTPHPYIRGSFVVKDMSGNGNDLTLNGASLEDTPKLFSNSKVVSLSKDRLAIVALNSISTTGLSISFWVYPTNNNEVRFFDYQYVAFGANGTWRIGFSNSSILTFNFSPANAVMAGVLQPNQWHQIVAVCTGTKVGLYIDGKTAGNTQTIATGCNFPNKTLTLGSSLDPAFYLDNVRIYKQALPLSFIQSQYLAELPEFKSLAKNVMRKEN